MDYRDTPLCFDCDGATLVGIVTAPVPRSRVGVLIVVGGPQYRVGSHRQFVALARGLAGAGVASMRFDYRGMGDSEGESVRFDATAPDIAAAVRIFREHLPEIETVVLWGLCDGAAACALAEPDPSIGGMVLVNPWVRTDEGAAKATLRHYYIRQVLAPVFWRKLARGGIELRRAVGGLFETLRRATRPSVHRAPAGARPLPERVASGILRHATPTLVMLSGNDQTAVEFRLVAHRSGALRSALNAVALTEVEIPDADHTLSAARWRDRATQLTVDWLYANFPARFAVDR